MLAGAVFLPLGRVCAQDTAPDDSGATAAAGQLLVASSDITDPRFVRTVIVIVRHDADGAIGLVINRPIEERPLAEVLEAIGEEASSVEGAVRIFSGGPVEPALGLVLHTADYRNDATVPIDMALSVTTNAEILRDIGRKAGPLKSLIAFGYAGWAPGQIEDELDAGGWLTASADPALIFDNDRDGLWELALKRHTIPL